MIKLKDLLEGVSTSTKKALQKVKPIATANSGRVIEMLSNSLKNDFKTVTIVLPTKNIDKTINSLESFQKSDGWYIANIGWFEDEAAEKLIKTSDSGLAKKLDFMYTYDEKKIHNLPYKKGLSTNTVSEFKSAKLGFIELKPSYAGTPHDLSKTKFFYHITLQSKLDNIKKKGLIPKTRTDRTYPPRVFVFDNKQASNDLMKILHMFKKSKDKVVVIQMSGKLLYQAVPDIEFWYDPEASGGYYTDTVIPPTAFEKVLGVDEKGKTYDLQK